MKSRILGAAVAATFIAGAAHAATEISIQTFSIADFNNLTMGPTVVSSVIEDFEEIGASEGAGELSGPLGTSVGTFSSFGGTGDGGTCDNNSVTGDCDQVALVQGPNSFDQGNLVPDDGEWSLNNNDTDGIFWDAEIDGGEFNRLVFAIKDAADRPGITSVNVETDDGGFASIDAPLDSGSERLVLIKFSSLVTSADVSIMNMGNLDVNDSFSIDGAAAVNVVPIPAAGFLLLGGLGGLAALKRRKQKAA